MPVKLALEKAPQLQTTVRMLLWLCVSLACAVVAALLIVTLFGSG